MRRFAAMVLGLALAAPAAFADSLSGPHAVVELLPGWRTGEGTHMAALRITLDEGWKTYWRAPGEAGIPPGFDWSGSTNVAALNLHWPVPEVVTSNGMTTLGYHGVLMLPIEIVPEDSEADITLIGALEMGICHDICMPIEAQVSAALPHTASAADARIEGALRQRPATAGEAGLVSARCTLEPIPDGLRVTASLDLPPVGAEELVVFEPENRAIWVSEAESLREGGLLTARADLVPPEAKPFEFDPAGLRLTVIAGGHAVDIQGCSPLR